ncbi:unnamed protein product [Peniophora sp. CBMAI 1063]|nr:unnamed protein product [Peniophora sp. CBMAI 1063]
MVGGGEVSILGTMVVVVLKAQNLIDNHKFYKQDPYAVLSLASQTQKTPPDPKGGQHPVWDEEMRFPIMAADDARNRTLKVKVYSKEKKDDLLLGEGEVDISETLRTGEFDDWVPLKIGDTQRGELYLEMTFFSAGPAPLNRRKSKFTPAQRLSRPADTQQYRPPQQHRGSHSSQSASPPPHPQHLAVPNSRSHSGSPAHKDAALPPLPVQSSSAPPQAVPAILRAGAGAAQRPRVQSTVAPTARPMSYAPSERPVSYAGPDLEPELPTPTQYNPNPHPFQQPQHQKPQPATYQSPQPSAQPYVSSYPPYHAGSTSAPSSPPLPPAQADTYVSPYPPYHTPSQGPPSPPAHAQTHGRTASFSSLASQQQQYAPHQPTHAGTAPGGYPPAQSHAAQPPASYPPQSQTPQPPGAYPTAPSHSTSTPPAGFHFPTPTPNYSTPPANYSSPPPQQGYNGPHGGFYGPPPAGRGYGYNPSQYGQPPRVPSRASSNDLPDPYLEKRYQTPLPLPGSPPTTGRVPSYVPPAVSAPAPASVPAVPRVDPGEVAAREMQARLEAADRARREQEEKDAELARRLDQELNIG